MVEAANAPVEMTACATTLAAVKRALKFLATGEPVVHREVHAKHALADLTDEQVIEIPNDSSAATHCGIPGCELEVNASRPHGRVLTIKGGKRVFTCRNDGLLLGSFPGTVSDIVEHCKTIVEHHAKS